MGRRLVRDPGGSGPNPDLAGALAGDGGDEAAATRQRRSGSGKTGAVGLARGAVAGAAGRHVAVGDWLGGAGRTRPARLDMSGGRERG